MSVRRPERGGDHRQGWSQSARFREIGRKAIRGWNAVRHKLKRCEARRRGDGGVCQQWPMPNGRCYLHGGRTPKGKDWHRPVLSADSKKLFAKLDTLDRKARKRATRLGAMTSEQQIAHALWHKTHKSGDPSHRRADRERTRQTREAAVFFRDINQRKSNEIEISISDVREGIFE